MEIAENLGIPTVVYMLEVSYNGEYFKVKHKLDDLYKVILAKPLCLITFTRDLNVPRYIVCTVSRDLQKRINVLKR
uniref:Uncharacterized protein n=1 Tax=Fervidobacterium thailandense TaxID=1008305 RepID=A0A7C4RVC5_9BACT